MTVATIGVFDGVHLGHRALISAACDVAQGSRVTAITFDPHPRSVVAGSAPTFLASMPHRIELLQEAGIDDVRVLTFDEDLAALSPDDFVTKILIDELGISDVVVGENFRFGARAAGDVARMASSGLCVHPQPLVGDGAGRWSSTRIRDLLVVGDVGQAAVGLARPYRIEGGVVHGAHRGRTLGYPTANIAWDPRATVPADGVYAGFLVVDGVQMPAAISVGTNPQFDGAMRSVEAYVLDRDDLDLYDVPVAADFVSRLRAQERFADVAALQAQMAHDVDAARLALR
jgi:riboflavin kinase/FMN adenylyltransferase